MEMQVPDLSAMRGPQPSVPLFMLKMETLKLAVEANRNWRTSGDITALADRFLMYVMSPEMPEAHDDAPASLIEDF